MNFGLWNGKIYEFFLFILSWQLNNLAFYNTWQLKNLHTCHFKSPHKIVYMAKSMILYIHGKSVNLPKNFFVTSIKLCANLCMYFFKQCTFPICIYLAYGFFICNFSLWMMLGKGRPSKRPVRLLGHAGGLLPIFVRWIDASLAIDWFTAPLLPGWWSPHIRVQTLTSIPGRTPTRWPIYAYSEHYQNYYSHARINPPKAHWLKAS